MWRRGCYLDHGGGALGIFNSPVCLYNRSWHGPLSASQLFIVLSHRSARRMYTASGVKRLVVLNYMLQNVFPTHVEVSSVEELPLCATGLPYLARC